MGVVTDLAGALDLEQVGEHRYRGHSVESPERDVVFGGQLLAQLAIAAARGAGAGKAVKTAHALFARAATKTKPLDFEVDVLHGGRTVASATTTVSQDGRPCARALVLLTAGERDLIRHAAPMPAVAPPEDLKVVTDPFVGRELCFAGDVDLADPAAVGPAELAVWTRMPDAPYDPDDPALGQGILTHASAGFMIGAALRPHAGFGVGDAHDKFSTGILGHCMTFHEDFRADEWILLAQESPYAGRGRSYGRGHAFTRDGRLVASFTQDAIVRHFPGGDRGAGRDRAGVL